jgi:hypothetical protein
VLSELGRLHPEAPVIVGLPTEEVVRTLVRLVRT